MLRRIQHIHRVVALNLLLELQADALLLLIPYRSNPLLQVPSSAAV